MWITIVCPSWGIWDSHSLCTTSFLWWSSSPWSSLQSFLSCTLSHCSLDRYLICLFLTTMWSSLLPLWSLLSLLSSLSLLSLFSLLFLLSLLSHWVPPTISSACLEWLETLWLKMGVHLLPALALICHLLLPIGVIPELWDSEDVCHPWQWAMCEGHPLCGDRWDLRGGVGL